MTNSTDKMVESQILSLKNPVFCAYLISSCFLIIKMMFMTLFTTYKRSVHKAFLSPEDGEVKTNDEVERVRWAHLNDLENIPIFWTSAFAYLWTEPSISLACFLYFGFVVLRTFHTLVYAILAAPQPTRAILFSGGFAITLYMTIHSIVVGFQNLC